MTATLKRTIKRLPGVLKLRDYWLTRGFAPYIKTFTLAQTDFRFFIATPQARQWYDPIKHYAHIEYEWVLGNVPLHKQAILDAGAHHGHYTVVFCIGSRCTAEIVAVDPFASNCDLININAMLNECSVRTEQCLVGVSDEPIRFLPRSNGYVVSDGGVVVPSKTLAQIMPHATVVKLDIEGFEFAVLPLQIDSLPSVHTWIVEIHPNQSGKPEAIVKLFTERGYRLHWVNRSTDTVEVYPSNAEWTSQTTLIAQREI